MIQKLDHVTLVVRDLDEALKSYEKILRLTPWSNGVIEHPPECRLVVLPTKSGARIEFIEPNLAVDSRFSRFLKERGEGVFGLSIFVEDFDAEVRTLKKKGVPVEEETQTFLFSEYPFRIDWVPPEEGHGVWIEIVDSEALPSYEREWEFSQET